MNLDLSILYLTKLQKEKIVEHDLALVCLGFNICGILARYMKHDENRMTSISFISSKVNSKTTQYGKDIIISFCVQCDGYFAIINKQGISEITSLNTFLEFFTSLSFTKGVSCDYLFFT